MLAQKFVYLVLSLENIGHQYTYTRHNAGFWLVDEIAKHYQVTFKSETKFFAEVARLNIAGDEVFLLKPQTLMNLSGN
jgi:PTH1 family peptidyl-tRNA hydrolase